MTNRDRQIIEAVYHCRALTAPQIAALYFSKDGNQGEVNARCKHRLRMLYHHGYLFRDEQPSKLSEGRKPLVYFLDQQGAEFLASSQEAEIDWDRHDNNVLFPFLQHLLATNDIRIAIILCTRKHEWEIIRWTDDKTLKSPQMKDKVKLKNERGKGLQAAIVPDGYCRLRTHEDTYNFFVEIDRGTVTGEATKWGKRDWGRKIKAYLEYYRSGMYQSRYATRDLRILTVTTGETRLSHLKAITEGEGGKGRFWFSTFNRITGRDILTDPVWSIANREGLWGLLS